MINIFTKRIWKKKGLSKENLIAKVVDKTMGQTLAVSVFDIDYYLTHEEVNLMNNISNIGTFERTKRSSKSNILVKIISQRKVKEKL